MRGTVISAVCVGISLLGCSGADVMDADQGSLSSEAQEVWRSDWVDNTGHSPNNVRGIAHPPRAFVSFIWFSDGQMARGQRTFGPETTPYSCGTKNCADIRGIGIAQNTSHIYSWYQDGTLMEGIPENLSFYRQYPAGKLRMPTNPMTGALFRMNDMLDVDNSPNGEWYFYWRDPGTQRVFRTTGTSDDATRSSPQRVTTLDPAVAITAISFFNWPEHHQDTVETWYANHRFNDSTSSLVLTQN